jgi:hypothetical protein
MFLSVDFWSKSFTNALKEIYKKNILVMNKNNVDVKMISIAPQIFYITRYILNILWKIIIDLCTQI